MSFAIEDWSRPVTQEQIACGRRFGLRLAGMTVGEAARAINRDYVARRARESADRSPALRRK